MNILLGIFLVSCIVVQVNGHGNHFEQPLSQINVGKVRSLSLSEMRVSTVQIKATPTLLSHTQDTVTVSWSGVQQPNNSDWIGVYSPSDVNRTMTAPVKYRWANTSSTHLSTGSGSVQFNLINGRGNYSFTFFQNGYTSPISVATSNIVEFENYNEPLQGRLSMTTKPDQMRVIWTTRDLGRPQVKWGKSSGKYKWSAEAETVTYGVEDLCGPPATTIGWREPGLFHAGVMKNLKPGQQYFYIYGDENFGWSQENSFFAVPQANASDHIRFFAFGDMGQAASDGANDAKWSQPDGVNITGLLLKDLEKHKNNTHLVLHIGDLSYADGYSSVWDDFCEQISPLAKQLAYQTTPGNHECDYLGTETIFVNQDSGGECGVPFYMRFPLPSGYSQKPDGENLHWYSFNTGPLHIIMMSTEHNFSSGSAQYKFIKNDLSSVDRSLTPWVVFTGHRPMYVDAVSLTVNDSHANVSALLRQEIEPLLVKYRVDVVLWGHHHSYQRTCYVINQTCMAKPDTHISNTTTTAVYRTNKYVAPVHFVIGMGGALLTRLQPVQPDHMLYVNGLEYGYAIVEVDSNKSFHLSFITESAQLRDDVWIFKDF